jgi:hypothetical protein
MTGNYQNWHESRSCVRSWEKPDSANERNRTVVKRGLNIGIGVKLKKYEGNIKKLIDFYWKRIGKKSFRYRLR